MSLGAFNDGTDYMPNTQFGIYQDPNSNKTYVFTQGSKTLEANMPTSGEVKYYGLSAYHVNNETLNKNQDVANATNWQIRGVNLTANFAEKTLKGTLTYSDVPDIEIDTKISGNTFSSDANSDTQVKGEFYGDKVQELGGVYVNKKSGYAGAFSAKQW